MRKELNSQQNYKKKGKRYSIHMRFWQVIWTDLITTASCLNVRLIIFLPRRLLIREGHCLRMPIN